MINVKRNKLTIYAKVGSTSKDGISYEAWVSVGTGMKKQESATVDFSMPRHLVSGSEQVLEAAVQADLNGVCAYLYQDATPKEAFNFLKDAAANRMKDAAEWKEIAGGR